MEARDGHVKQNHIIAPGIGQESEARCTFVTMAYQMSVMSLDMIPPQSILKCNNHENTPFNFVVVYQHTFAVCDQNAHFLSFSFFTP